MGEAAKKICVASLEDQSSPEKSTVVKPFSFKGPTKLLASAGSSFQVWQKPSSKNLGDAEGSSNPMLDLQLAISNTFSAQAADNNNNTMENPALDQAEKNLVNGILATSGAGGNGNTIQTYEGQARQPGLDLKLASEMEEMDPKKMKRIMANRIYSKKYRLKKNHYVANLEKLSSTLKTKISHIRPQIDENKNQQRSLLIEHHKLKLQMAALEKDRILKEDEIEKNREEVNRLREVQKQQLQVNEHARMLNSDAGLQLMPNSNSVPSSLGQMVYKNSDQALIANSGLLKSEPET